MSIKSLILYNNTEYPSKNTKYIIQYNLYFTTLL